MGTWHSYMVILFVVSFQSCVNHDLTKPVDCSQHPMVLAIDSIAEASSCTVADGKIYASIQGGTAPYHFQLNGENPKSSPVFTGVHSGIYTISVQDQGGCRASLENISVPAHDFKFSANVESDTDCLTGNGGITIMISTGNPPFLYTLNGGTSSTLNSFSGLRAGLYAVTVKDGMDCLLQLRITVPRGHTGTRWSADIVPIIKTYCAVNGCHDGKTRSDYKQYQYAKKDALSIKSMTQDKSMPFDGTPLTQRQIDLIACWVDDGAIEN